MLCGRRVFSCVRTGEMKSKCLTHDVYRNHAGRPAAWLPLGARRALCSAVIHALSTLSDLSVSLSCPSSDSPPPPALLAVQWHSQRSAKLLFILTLSLHVQGSRSARWSLPSKRGWNSQSQHRQMWAFVNTQHSLFSSASPGGP